MMHFYQIIKCLLLVALFGCDLIEVECLSFRYPKFETENDKDFIRNNSYIVLDAIQVTPDVSGGSITNQSGRALYKKPFKLWSKSKNKASFNSTFVLNISPRTNPGGEGLAFILTADSNLPEKSQGQWLGIVNANTNGNSHANIVAVEFDTRKSYPEDIDSNHVGLDVNGIYSIKQVSLDVYGINISAAIDVYVQIQYDGENLTLFVGNYMVFSEHIDLSTYLPENVFVGFSASTSNYTELNCVKSWKFYSSDINEDKSLMWVRIFIPIGAALLIGIAIAFYLGWKWNSKSKMDGTEDAYPSIEEEIKGSSMAPKKFTIKELRKATSKFNSQNMLGKGGFGSVYRGTLKNKEVAVKRISRDSIQGKQEFISEVKTIGNVHHKNLVKLIGWCYERSEFLLVYEYMPNGSLDKFISREERAELQEQEKKLNWGKRLDIISGVAQALDYLHNGCEKRVLHRDIKTSNIMLDSEFNAKLGDFGLARVVEQTHHSTKELAGTLGYMAPECFFTRRAIAETDVYAFGVLVLEVVCGRKPGNQNEQSDYNSRIVCWVWELYRIGRLVEAADERLNGDFWEEEMKCVLILGLACCNPNSEQRPSMKTVLQVLTGEAPVPVVPTKMPAFVWPSMPHPVKESDCSLIGSQLTPFSEISGR